MIGQVNIVDSEIGQRVIKSIYSSLNLKSDSVISITENTKLIDDLGADSLDVVEVVMSLETEFGIEIPDEDAQTIETVGDAINYISGKVDGTKA